MSHDRGLRLQNAPGAWDTLVGWPDRYWVGSAEDDITELGIRAARWGIEENEGGNRADIMLEDLFGGGR